MPSVSHLLEYVTATADANGTATAEIGPRKYGDSWTVTLLATSTNSAAESRLRVFRGAVMDSALLATTYSGNNDNAGGSPIKVTAGDKLVFQWTNATPGAICTCRIEGDLESRRY